MNLGVSVAAAVTDQRWLFINGGWQSPNSDHLIEIISANTGRQIGSVPEADSADVDAAVGAARAAATGRKSHRSTGIDIVSFTGSTRVGHHQ